MADETGPVFAESSYAGQVKCPEVGFGGESRKLIGRKMRNNRKMELNKV